MISPRVCAVALLACLYSLPATALDHHLRHSTISEPVVATLALQALHNTSAPVATVAVAAKAGGPIQTRPQWEVEQMEKEEAVERAHAEPHKEEKHEEHHEEKHESGESPHESTGHVVALSFMSTIALFSTVFSMANSDDEKVRNYTLIIVDNCVAILLAVMYFQAVDGYIKHIGMPGPLAAISAIVHAIAYLAGALIVAAMLRDNAVFLAIFCGAGAHVVSFTSIHASAHTQNSVWMGQTGVTGVDCFLGLTALAAGIALIGFVVYKVKQHTHLADDDEFMDRTDDLENDFGAMGFSVCFTMFIRFLISGHHPVDDDTDFDHTATQRNLMLVWAFASLLLAIPITAYTSRQSDVASERKSYFWKRVWTFFGSVATLNVTWAFLYWGEWEFYGNLFGSGSPILGRIAWAVVASMAGCLGVYGLSNVTGNKMAHTVTVALAALGLVVAFSWEVCFDAAIDSMTEDSPYNPGHIKMACTLLMAAFILPMYAKHLKPMSMKAAEAIGG